MNKFEIYNSNAANSQTIWLVFLLAGWSYGSLGNMTKQIFFYLTLGGFGLWTLYRLFTLNKAIKKYNKAVAIKAGMKPEDLIQLDLL